MAVTKITYTANGSLTQYTLPFEYIAEADVDVYVDEVLQLQQNTTSTADPTHPQVISGEIAQGTPLINYTFANATTIEFNSAPTNGAFLFIERTTDDASVVTFVPGSTIRAQELNTALEQVRFMAQEGVNTAKDAITPSRDNAASVDARGLRIENLANADSDDDAVNRGQLGKVITDDLIEGEAIDLTDVSGGTNSGKQVTISVEDSSKTNKGAVSINEGEGIDVTYTNGDAVIAAELSTASNKGVVQVTATTPITASYTSPGELALSIADGTVDLAKLKADDVRTLAEQNASPNDSGSDDEVGTTAALNKRHDVIYQSGTPSGTDWPSGKLWYDHTNDQTLYVWSGSTWLGITSGGTFITQPTVIWVDSVNGDDANDGHRIIDAMKTIKAAVASANDGDIVFVNPGVYRETAPIDITVNNLSIVGQSIRSCFVHPTPATETESLFRVNSGTLISNFSFAGIKASGTRGGHPVDSDPTYGLPTNQGWLASFYPNAVIYKSPYIQNCTNFCDSAIPNWTEAEYNDQVTYPQATAYFDPNNVTQGGFGGDLTSGPTGGGLFIDGSVPSVNSPLRSMVVDSFTQVTLDGPGCLCANNGYAQLVSFFGTFAHYHAKSLNGGQLNLSNCTTDFGRYGLIADGKSTTAIFTASVTANASPGAITFTIGAPTAASNWYGAATKPQDSMLVQIGSDIYPILSSTANGSGWDVTILNPNPIKLSQNLGLTNAITAGATASFFQRSFISTGGHTFEYVGSGTDYTALPENGGEADETKQAISLNNGKVWQSSTDHNGVFKVGNTFKVDQRSGTVEISLDAYRPEIINDLTPQLGGDLDVNGYDIVDTSGSGVTINGLAYPSVDGALDHVLTTDGNGTLAFQAISNITGAGLQNVVDDPTPELGGQLDALTNKIVNLGTPTANTDAATKAYVDSAIGNVDAAFIETAQTLTADKVIAANINAACVGPIAVNAGVTITIGANSKLVVLN